MQLGDVFTDNVVNGMVITAKIVIAYLAVIWLALAYWTYRDIRRRSGDWFVQGAAVLLTLALFIPGYWIYLILRPATTLSERNEEALRRTLLSEYGGVCGNCHKTVREDYIICPDCCSPLKSACTNCSHALQASWKACPYCGQQGRPAVRVQATPIPMAAIAPVDLSTPEVGEPSLA
jgi:RNA polymerase subunit RPABC4/transcription elongation factor Spt4